MQRKTIEKVLSQKFNDWIKTIKDEKVKELVKRNSIITGGCITSMFLGEEVNDYDVYFTNRKTVIAVADYYVKLFNKKNKSRVAKLVTFNEFNKILNVATTAMEDELVEEENQLLNLEVEENKNQLSKEELKKLISEDDSKFESIDVEKEMEKEDGDRIAIFIKSSGIAYEHTTSEKKYRPMYLTDNSITLSGEIQIIIRFWGNHEKIHENFDFSHCTNYWLSSNRKLYTNLEALECILSKTLFYRGSKYPLCSIIRTRKFINRGWKINAGQYLKMALQLNEMDLKEVTVLREQLIGVDVNYFNQLIESIEAKSTLNSLNNLNEGIDTSYVIELINKIFDGEDENQNQ